LTRALLFVPLFTLLIVRLHRNTLAGSPGLTGVLNLPLLTYLVRHAGGRRQAKARIMGCHADKHLCSVAE
jgi:hypothetical protein